MKFDVLGFTETRLDGDISPLYTLPEYQMFTTNRNRYDGGVAIYASSKYECTKVKVYYLLEMHIESLGIEAKRDYKVFFYTYVFIGHLKAI